MAKNTFNEMDEFCWQLRDGINKVVENHSTYDSSFNLSTKENRALHKLIAEKNKVHVINDTDKNLGPANADKSDVIRGRLNDQRGSIRTGLSVRHQRPRFARPSDVMLRDTHNLI